MKHTTRKLRMLHDTVGDGHLRVRDMLAVIMANDDTEKLARRIAENTQSEDRERLVREMFLTINYMMEVPDDDEVRNRIIFASVPAEKSGIAVSAYREDTVQRYTPGENLRDALNALTDPLDRDEQETMQLLQNLFLSMPSTGDLSELSDFDLMNAEVDVTNLISVSLLNLMAEILVQRNRPIHENMAWSHKLDCNPDNLLNPTSANENKLKVAVREEIDRSEAAVKVFFHMKGIQKNAFFERPFPMSVRQFLYTGAKVFFSNYWTGAVGNMSLEQKIDFLENMGDFNRQTREDVQVICYDGFWGEDGDRSTFIRAYRTEDILRLNEGIHRYFEPFLTLLDCDIPIKEFIQLDPEYVKENAGGLGCMLPVAVQWDEESKEFFDFQVCKSQGANLRQFYDVLCSNRANMKMSSLYYLSTGEWYAFGDLYCVHDLEEEEIQNIIKLYNLVARYEALKACRDDIVAQLPEDRWQ